MNQVIAKNSRVYILGNIPDSISLFRKAQGLLEKNGFVVVNQLDEAMQKRSSRAETNRIKFSKIMESNILYVLPNFKSTPKANTELKMAIDLNLIIIHDTFLIEELVD